MLSEKVSNISMTKNDDAAEVGNGPVERDGKKLVGENMRTSKIYKDEEGNKFLYFGRTKNTSWSELEKSQANSNKKCQQQEEVGLACKWDSTSTETRRINDLWEMKKKSSDSERPKG